MITEFILLYVNGGNNIKIDFFFDGSEFRPCCSNHAADFQMRKEQGRPLVNYGMKPCDLEMVQPWMG